MHRTSAIIQFHTKKSFPVTTLQHVVRLLFFSILTFVLLADTIEAQRYKEMIDEGSFRYDDIMAEGEKYFQNIDKGRGSGYKQFMRWAYWSGRNLDVNGNIISPKSALSSVSKFEAKYPGDHNKGLDSYWMNMGPESAINTSTWSSHLGRISAIGLDESNPNHIIVGAPTGGVWKTQDEGQTWIPIFDSQPTIGVYALAISPGDPNLYLCGTTGMGILISKNAGASWAAVSGITSTNTFNRILFDPDNHNVVLAIDQTGAIYRSTDRGDTWVTTFSSGGPDLYDLEFKPGQPDSVYASGHSRLYVSDDNGQSFSEIAGPWSFGPMMMGVSPANPEYLYVLQADSQGGFRALYLSKNAGSSFSTQSDDSSNNNNIMGYELDDKGGQAPRDMDIIVAPDNVGEVHVAGIMTFRSVNEGKNWAQTTHWVISNPLPFIHADVDIMIYRDTTIYFGTDGGFFISRDSASSIIDRTQGINTRQFYRIGVSQTELDRVSGGSQDNGTGILRQGTWYDFVGADGMETFIDRNNENTVYASIQFGSLYKSINGGNSLAGISNTPGNGAWVTPLEQDPHSLNTLYQGKRHLYKSTNGGISWTPVSNINPSNPGDNQMREIKPSPAGNQTIFLAYRFQLYKTTNGGMTWLDVTPPVNFSQINFIGVHPTDSTRLAIALSGANEKFMESLDGGNVWTDITDNLPDIGAECILYEGNSDEGIFVGMNPGIYYRDDLNTNWQMAVTGLPNVRVTELEIAFNQIYAGTYGRGLWKAGLGENPAHCFDGVYNGNEVWVDCGGSCNPCTDCDGDSISLSGLMPDKTFRRMKNWIMSSNQLNPGSSARLQAGEFVSFLEGTSFSLGSDLEVNVADCDN